MYYKDVAVTGIGLMTPHKEVAGTQLFTRKLTKKNYPININNMEDMLTKRQLKKVDKFTAMAICTIKSAFDDASVSNLFHDAGLIIGNVFGGWDYVEKQMYRLYQGDFSSINPYVATAWFPAAPQGEASILYNYQGYSKTISADSLSAAFAIEHGANLLSNKKLTSVCCGGVEAPVTPVILKVLESEQLDAEYSKSDAAAFFCLESETAAHESGKYKFTIEAITFGRDLNDLLKIYHENSAQITTLVHSPEVDLDYFTGIRNFYCTDSIFGKTYGAVSALDLYLAYQAALLDDSKALILRKNEDGQYWLCLVSIYSNDKEKIYG